MLFLQSKSQPQRRGEYNVYSTFQSHEPEFDYLKSLEIEEKINKIRWLPQQNAAYFLLSTNGQSVTPGYNCGPHEGLLFNFQIVFFAHGCHHRNTYPPIE